MQNSTAAPGTRTKNKGNNGYLFPLFISVAAGELVTLLVVALASMIVSKVDMPALVTVFSFIALIVGSGITGILTGMAFRQERIFMGLMSGLILSILLVLLNLIFYREPITVLSFVKYGVILLASVGATFLVKNRKKRKIKR